MPSLKKTLGLADVYAIATGAMFSSGFFLLPGIAAIESGSSVPLAYLFAGVLILPAMLSVAELSTAMPRAGGAYYFLDRSMGPLLGTIGGLGTWVALVLKSAFALLGMGAYLMLFVDVPIKPVAVGLTVLFAVLNVVGAKETSGLQRVLVFSLVAILVFILIQSTTWVLQNDPVTLVSSHHEAFLEHGIDGLFATVGIVFVAFAGLTKVASVAEEVQDPDRNIPLGMMLSLATATTIYVVGVALMTIVLDAESFHASYTPVADLAKQAATWIPADAAVALTVVAATAAFASTGNAGVLSSSRYPMAMARDGLLPARFAELSPRFGTPVLGVVATAAMMVALIVAFDITAVAKLASAFQLMLFGLINVAVVVMRESRIDWYQPGYRSPLYPWVQLAGVVIPVWLIVEMGWLAVLFTGGVVAGCVAWYHIYAKARVARTGAVYHVFERLGRRVHRGLDDELRAIVAEKGLDDGDPLEQVVVDAEVVELPGRPTLESTFATVAALLDKEPQDDVYQALFADPVRLVHTTGRAGLAHVCSDDLSETRLVLVRALEGLGMADDAGPESITALAVLVGPKSDFALHMRILAHFSRRVAEVDFAATWCEASGPVEVREVMLRDDRYVRFSVKGAGPTAALAGRRLREAVLPRGVIVALIERRGGGRFVPDADTELAVGDRVTAIGDPGAVRALRGRYGEPRTRVKSA